MPPFTGFPDPDATFFFRLAEHQSREWFQANKAEHVRDWVEPMTSLLEEVTPKIERLFDGRHLTRPKIFRINRDVRFSPDKSPYKTHIGGYLAIDGPEGSSLPAALYLQFGTESFVGAGHYHLEPEQIVRFRRAVAADATGLALTRAIADAERKGFKVSALDSLKRVPKDFDPEHPRADLLKWKSLVVHYPQPPREAVASHDLVAWLAERTKVAAPIVNWLADLG